MKFHHKRTHGDAVPNETTDRSALYAPGVGTPLPEFYPPRLCLGRQPRIQSDVLEYLLDHVRRLAIDSTNSPWEECRKPVRGGSTRTHRASRPFFFVFHWKIRAEGPNEHRPISPGQQRKWRGDCRSSRRASCWRQGKRLEQLPCPIGSGLPEWMDG